MLHVLQLITFFHSKSISAQRKTIHLLRTDEFCLRTIMNSVIFLNLDYLMDSRRVIGCKFPKRVKMNRPKG